MQPDPGKSGNCIHFVNMFSTIQNVSHYDSAVSTYNIAKPVWQYSPVPRARSSIAGKDAQIYAGLGTYNSADKAYLNFQSKSDATSKEC